VAAERAGRHKLNGRLIRRPPLSTLVELEALTAAVAAKPQRLIRPTPRQVFT